MDYDECVTAGAVLGLTQSGTLAANNTGLSRFKRPRGCFFDLRRRKLQMNIDGVAKVAKTIRENLITRPSICLIAPTPTASTTHAPITSRPTRSPTPQFMQAARGSSCRVTKHILSVTVCAEAAVNVGLVARGVVATINEGGSRFNRPYGCYFDSPRNKLKLNFDGDKNEVDTFRHSICYGG
jgi:hypothetical protein